MHPCWLVLLLFSVPLTAQVSPADSLVDAGIRHYREGAPARAEALYQRALRLNKHHGRALYELAYIAFERGDFERCIRYTKKIRRYREATLARAYQLEGAALDELGEDQQAIKRYRQGLKIYPDNHLLLYNLALVYFQDEQFAEAIASLEKALIANPTHASSHYMLGYIWTAYQNKLPATLALQFFLLLEPDSPRSKQALDLLEDALAQINTRSRLQVAPANALNVAEHTVALGFRQQPLADRPTDLAAQLRLLNELTAESFGPAVGEQSGFFWTFYADFFVNVHAEGHLRTLTHFITQQRGGSSYFWLEGHQPEVRALFDWLASVE